MIQIHLFFFRTPWYSRHLNQRDETFQELLTMSTQLRKPISSDKPSPWSWRSLHPSTDLSAGTMFTVSRGSYPKIAHPFFKISELHPYIAHHFSIRLACSHVTETLTFLFTRGRVCPFMWQWASVDGTRWTRHKIFRGEIEMAALNIKWPTKNKEI